MPDRDVLLRHTLLRTVIIGLFLVLLGNLFRMTVVDHGDYVRQAKLNRQVSVRWTAPRGRILDRDGHLLAANVYIADITVPQRYVAADSLHPVLERLVHWFRLDPEATATRLREQRARRGRLVLRANADPQEVTTVEEYDRLFPGVRVETRPRRHYVYRELMAHVVGHVGEVGPEIVGTGDDPYQRGDIIGKQGIESAMETELRGRNGLKLEEVNASGRVVGREPQWVAPVVAGRDVTISLSERYQSRLALAIGDRTACGVALDVRTGEVLAAYSSPSYDPNLLTGALREEDWRALIDDPDKPFFNRIVQATYPPASLYKPVVSLAALNADLVSRSAVLEPCLGGWTLGNRRFRCWKHAGHGEVDHVDALVHSCDTFYYQLALRLDLGLMAEAARSFGLGSQVTSLFPEEARGNVPDDAWYDERYGEGRWTRGVILNNSIGQGELLVTPMQMAVLAGRLATSGSMPDPVFVIDPPQPVRRPDPLPFAAADLRWVRNSLREVVDRGTGRAAALEGVTVAGKTGTAQNPHGEDHAWFMCFAPFEAPEVALAVIVENGGNGSSTAAPIAQAWLSTYFGVPGASEGQAATVAIPGGGD